MDLNLLKRIKKRVGMSRTNYDTSWTLFDKKNKVVENVKGASCYASLPRNLTTESKKIQLYVSPKITLNKETLKKWFDSVISCGMLMRRDITTDELISKGIVLDFDHPLMTTDRFYIAASMLRMPLEAVEVVQNTMDLVDADYHFLVAFYFAHGHCSFNANHSFLPFNGGSYATPGGYRTSLQGMQYFLDYWRYDILQGENLLKYYTSDKKYRTWGVAHSLLKTKPDFQVSEHIRMCYPPICKMAQSSTENDLKEIQGELEAYNV